MTDPKRVVVPLLAGPGNPHKGLGGQEQNCSQVTGGGTKQKSLQGTENERDSPGGRRQSGQHPAPARIPSSPNGQTPPSRPADICQAPTKCLGGLRCQGHSWTQYVPLQFHWR